MSKKKSKAFKKNKSAEITEIGANPTIAELRKFFSSDDIADIGGSKLTAATYYACMLIRCNAIAKLPLKVKRKCCDKGGAEDLKAHPLYELLHLRPNRFTSAHDFVWATEFQRLHYGDAFWVKDNRGRNFRGLYLLDSTRVRIVVDDCGILSAPNAVYYIYNDPQKGDLIYKSDNIVHFKNFSRGGIKGTSIRHYLDGVIANEQYAANVIKSKYKNGLQDPLIVTYTGDLNEAKSKKIQKKFADMGGAKNAGKVVPIPTDFSVKQLETKLVNSQFFQLNSLTTRQIANGFGVKSFQLNDMEKSTYNNITQQNAAFYSDTLLNVITAYEQEINYKLLFEDERKDGVFVSFNPDVMLRADLLTRYQAYQIGISSGFERISEVREMEDMPFINGTDKLIIGNGASIPLEDLGKQYPNGGAKGGENSE